MSDGFDAFLAAADDRRDAFIAAGRRLGAAEQNVEKDFWVCWTLDALFNRLPPGGPRLLFKGGTSLTKAFGLISRFSEDIDVTVFRDDLGEGGSVEALEQLSGKKRKAKLDAIKGACQAFIVGTLQAQLVALFGETINRAKVPARPSMPSWQALSPSTRR
jgi:predicted nucleotidyltransferase component of viral defense system